MTIILIKTSCGQTHLNMTWISTIAWVIIPHNLEVNAFILNGSFICFFFSILYFVCFFFFLIIMDDMINLKLSIR